MTMEVSIFKSIARRMGDFTAHYFYRQSVSKRDFVLIDRGTQERGHEMVSEQRS